MRRPGVVAAGALALGFALLCGGCSVPQPDLVPGASSAVGSGLSVELLQLRTDYASRGLQLAVTNAGDAEVTVLSAGFASPFLVEPVTVPKAPSVIAAGRTVNLSTTLSAPDCAGGAADPVVTLVIERATGPETVTVTPGDPHSSLESIHAGDCSRAAFEAVVGIAFAPSLRIPDAAGGGPALLDLVLTPTGADGSVTLRSVGSTVLLSQVEGDARPVDLVLDGSDAPVTVTLSLRPARCDPHVIAEDKVGTLIPLRVDAGEFSDATFTVAADPALKAQLFTWIAGYCAW